MRRPRNTTAPALEPGTADAPGAEAASRSLALTPKGRVVPRPAPPGGDAPAPAVAARIERAFEAGSAAGLLHLGACEVTTPLPPDFAYWRDFGRRFMTALCATPGLEEARGDVEVPPPPREELEVLVRAAPPMAGAEYLTVQVLQSLWAEVLQAWRHEVRAVGGPVQAYLAAKAPAWNLVGRVHLHLAENKRDAERPFAFLATYTTGLTPQGKPRHRQLGEAVRESSSARDQARLLALLAPLQRAAERSPFLKELLERGELFGPLAWTPREAYRFLQDIPSFEQSGVLVRLPDWWKARRPPRPQVSLSVGGEAPKGLGLGAMLDFSVRLTLDGEALSEEELHALRAGTEGLVLLKGKWVEVDRGKLEEVLAHWKAVERHAGSDGVSFIEGMRLLAGASFTDSGGGAPDAARAWTGVQAGPWLARALAGMRGPDGLEAVEPGPALQATLRPYQREGLRWLWFLSRLGLGACLADDMGLGKTVQVLALLLVLAERGAAGAPHLLVVPASLIANWKAEAERFAPSLRVLVAHPSVLSARELAGLDGALGEVDLVITSYGFVSRLPWLRKTGWGLVILDEAQAIKNPDAKQARAVKQLQAKARIALTGTPIENRLSDLWSLFDFLNPGLLGSAQQFGAFIKRLQPGAYGPLRELVRPYILRRLKTDRSVISDLPDKTELRAFCSLSRRQAALYQQSVESLARELSEVDGMQRRGLVLAYLQRLKQICNHPSQWLGDGAFAPEDSGKYARLRELCEVIASRQEKVLVFTQFREMAAPLSDFLSGIFGRAGLVLHGQTAVKERQALVRRFQEDDAVPYFVLSLKAGGTGLNLTAASHVIHFDRWWNPAVESQATDRAFRIGQRRSVLVHKFVCRGTIEERIDALLESKAGLPKELFEGGSELRLTELKDEDLMRLVALDLRSVQADD